MWPVVLGNFFFELHGRARGCDFQIICAKDFGVFPGKNIEVGFSPNVDFVNSKNCFELAIDEDVTTVVVFQMNNAGRVVDYRPEQGFAAGKLFFRPPASINFRLKHLVGLGQLGGSLRDEFILGLTQTALPFELTIVVSVRQFRLATVRYA
jgi:hypothetical protein